VHWAVFLVLNLGSSSLPRRARRATKPTPEPGMMRFAGLVA
jgi:hypothetical protein